jgi:hypothetical protein
LSKIDSSRLIAKGKIEKLLFKKIENAYLLFSVDDRWFLIIEKKSNFYREYFLQKNDSTYIIVKSLKIRKHKKILKKAFNKNIYHKGFINLNSDFYKNGYIFSQGNETYFYYKDKDDNIYGESKLTTIINPNPIDIEIYNFLLTRLLKYIK